MTNQELFTKVRTHLLAQGQRSLDERGACMYRGAEGRKCAVGVLIPDERFDPDLEGKMCDTDVVMYAAGLAVDNVTLAKQLQFLHDNNAPERWEFRLRQIAENFNLEVQDAQPLTT